ncbi:MAG: polyprenyl synthetase family protein [Chloroflexi bacterium]|nr:polyprenyl synthetase family protein [Chloroflexota bacterium]
MTMQHTSVAAVQPRTELAETLPAAFQAVETLLVDAVDSEVAVLRDASRHIIAAGGKRFRPRLTLLAYAAVGGEDPNHAVPVAAAVELVHTASVVHDDINDHGVVRRGRPSVNALFGRTFALLTGDYLFTKVYELMAPYGDLNILLAEGTSALVEGETLQAAAVKEGNFTREVYYRVIALKTAALFKSAGAMGAKLAGGTTKQIDALANFGFNIGLAFQIVDDILDLIGDKEQLGKTAGLDLEQGRGFATAYAQEGAEPSLDDKVNAIKRKAMEGDALNQARTQAHMLVQQAINELEILPPSAAKDELANLAHMIVDRSF